MRPIAAAAGALVVAAILAVPILQAAAQGIQAFDVVKAERSESFSIPYAVANLDRKNPYVYTYETPKGQNWIFSVENKLSYVARGDAKVVVVLHDADSADKSIELHMYGGENKKYAVWVTTPEAGHSSVHLNEVRGWDDQQPIGVSFAANNGLTVTDGRRIVVDRLQIGSFNLGSVEVYGKDEQAALSNAYSGQLNIAVMYGSPADTPIYMVPAIVTGGVGAVVGVLLLLKKRKDRW
ncbi:hypothetical protein [Nitrososphaera sp.]|uniref:hypothetical protein n=1 Tax=Nitrososphaera sp. TaxID=1971748 RepID=UPI00307E8ADF